ncbi:MAG: NUDIX domain-containing protein [Spirochaetales bacterium]|nr:NUDIX domain-containing protein [Leptospiraceae bacterium]MCP5481850.1 NUDIX domain-containing protein [Spirochaetales bacterium]MCP5486343.1 NUDIX domain-containing protein [Spirochaetales bacterium]
MSPRTSAKAIIIESGQLLVLRNKGPNLFYTLPGGGQKIGESLPQAIRRECKEELGRDVEVGQLLFVRDYISDNHEFAALHPGVHQLELFFCCRLVDEAAVAPGEPDEHQVGVEWIALDRLPTLDLYPKAIRSHLTQLPNPGVSRPVYLGDVN